jgi:pyruvate,water dikinase
MVAPRSRGVAVVSLPKEKRAQAPLTNREVQEVYRTGRTLEEAFGWAQDVEWTYLDAQLYVLQSRPITTTTGISQQDNRAWYLSLHRSLENLNALRESIEKTYIPQMISDAERLSKNDLAVLDTEQLAQAIRDRQRIWAHWQKVYWDHFIPFAHAVRLFGQIYNRVVKPDDPHEFARLLPSAPLKSVQRNQRLIRMATAIGGRSNRAAKSADRRHHHHDAREVISEIARKADSSTLRSLFATTSVDKQTAFLAELSKVAGKKTSRRQAGCKALVERFLEAFPVAQRKNAAGLLELARASYKLRDDDNIYMGRVEAELLRALVEAKGQSRNAAGLRVATTTADQFVQALTNPRFRPSPETHAPGGDATHEVKARQLVGQPAGEGVAVGPARVVKRREDLLDFRRGEILICHAVDPNMTFVVPLAAAVVERRGGMLIHGAIIAREYGLPCITGVPDVCRAITTGDRITVDGYLGIVTVGPGSDAPALTERANSN